MNASYWGDLVHRRRISRRRGLALIGASAGAAALLGACGGGGSGAGGSTSTSRLVSEPVDTTKQAKSGGVIKWYVDREPNTLDVHINQNPLNTPKNFSYSQLTISKAGHLAPTEYEIVGDMAESWEWSPDRLQVTMKLRPGV